MPAFEQSVRSITDIDSNFVPIIDKRICNSRHLRSVLLAVDKLHSFFAIVTYFTPTSENGLAQAAELLKSFEWRMDRIEAASVLFGRVVDPKNIDIITRNFSETECRMLFSSLGILAFFSPDNPTARYSLDMSRQVCYKNRNIRPRTNCKNLIYLPNIRVLPST